MNITVEFEIDDELNKEAEMWAEQLGISRDEFYARALRSYIQELDKRANPEPDSAG